MIQYLLLVSILRVESQALRIFDAAQLYRVGRMIQEIVSAL